LPPGAVRDAGGHPPPPQFRTFGRRLESVGVGIEPPGPVRLLLGGHRAAAAGAHAAAEQKLGAVQR